jgi:hypothetical protein
VPERDLKKVLGYGQLMHDVSPDRLPTRAPREPAIPSPQFCPGTALPWPLL